MHHHTSRIQKPISSLISCIKPFISAPSTIYERHKDGRHCVSLGVTSYDMSRGQTGSNIKHDDPSFHKGPLHTANSEWNLQLIWGQWHDDMFHSYHSKYLLYVIYTEYIELSRFYWVWLYTGFGLIIGFIGLSDTARDCTFSSMSRTKNIAHSHVFTSRYLAAASCGERSSSSGFPNYPRPKPPASSSESSQLQFYNNKPTNFSPSKWPFITEGLLTDWLITINKP
jgi:hypothetical protein